MTFKEKMYYLITSYLEGGYNTDTFCDLFTDTFNLELDGSLREKEEQVFEDLRKITCRFSPFEEDLKIPNAFSDEQEVKDKVIEAINILGLTNK